MQTLWWSWAGASTISGRRALGDNDHVPQAQMPLLCHHHNAVSLSVCRLLRTPNTWRAGFQIVPLRTNLYYSLLLLMRRRAHLMPEAVSPLCQLALNMCFLNRPPSPATNGEPHARTPPQAVSPALCTGTHTLNRPLGLSAPSTPARVSVRVGEPWPSDATHRVRAVEYRQQCVMRPRPALGMLAALVAYYLVYDHTGGRRWTLC
jgi:hypothetical protein